MTKPNFRPLKKTGPKMVLMRVTLPRHELDQIERAAKIAGQTRNAFILTALENAAMQVKQNLEPGEKYNPDQQKADADSFERDYDKLQTEKANDA